MAQDPAMDLILAHQMGMESRTRRRKEAEEVEDRSVLKDILAHQLSTLKFEEKMRARKLSLENLGLRSGKPQNEVPSDQLDPLTDQQLAGQQTGAPGPDNWQGAGGAQFDPGMIATMPGTITPAQRRMRPMTIPGVPDLGISDEQVRPQTQEDMLQQLFLSKMAEASADTRVVGRGGSIVRGGQEIYRNPYTANPPNPQQVRVRNPDGSETIQFAAPEAGRTFQSAPPVDNTLVPITNRDARGNETTVQTPRSQAAGMTSTRAPLPPQPSTAQPSARLVAVKGAMAALDELDKFLNTKGPGQPVFRAGKDGAPGTPIGVKTDDTAWFSDNSQEPDEDYDAILTTAQGAVTAAFDATGQGGSAAEKTMLDLLDKKFTPERVKHMSIPNIKKQLAALLAASQGTVGGNMPGPGAVPESAGAPVPGGRLVNRNGKMVLIPE